MTRRTWPLAAGALALGAALGPAHAQDRFADVTIETTDLGDGLFMMVGAGGNLGVSVGPDGVFMIDDQFAPLTDKIEAAVDAIDGDEAAGEVRFIVNTHFHGDHTGGNEAWAGRGATVFAHDNVRARLSVEQIATFSGRPSPPADPGRWPTVTFADGVTFHMNGETVRVVHVPTAHTDGDAIVVFEERNVVHMGDLFFNGFYPYIDTEAGGSVDGYIAAQDQVIAMTDADTRIIPGHGPLATREDLQTMRDVLAGVRDAVQARIDAGDTLEEATAAEPLSAWDAEYGSFFINSETMVRIVYNDLAAAAAQDAADHGHTHDDGSDHDHAPEDDAPGDDDSSGDE